MKNDSLLNDAQKRSLSVALRTFEETLHHVETLLVAEGQHGITYEVVSTVDAQARNNLLRLIGHMREALQELVQLLSLKPEIHETGKRIYTDLFYCWEVLEGAKTKMLRRYGPVSSRLEAVLDPYLNRLIELLRTAGADLQSSTARRFKVR